MNVYLPTSIALVLTLALAGCAEPASPVDAPTEPGQSVGGKADEFKQDRRYEILLTNPHCDLCERADRDYLLENSAIIQRVVELIDGAESSVDVAQFTFSRAEIEAALKRAHERGVPVRLAMNHGQRVGSNVSNRLLEAGLDVRFIEGRDAGSFMGLMHAKYMIVDGDKLVTGSNNWSSTGPSINEENTIVMQAPFEDSLLAAFRCNFEKVWENDADGAATCSTSEVAFTPGFGAFAALRTALRASTQSIDVLMHHLLFENALRELTRAANRGVKVRVIVNAEDRDSISGNRWNEFFAAGGEVRYKLTNPEAFQIMHHKLAVIDDKVLFNGSGNWSGSAFFNNFEFFVRYDVPEVVEPFNSLFARLWSWSLTADSLDAGYSAAEQAIFERLEAEQRDEVELFFFADGRIPAGSTLRTVQPNVSLDYFIAWPETEALFDVAFYVWSDHDEDFIVAELLPNVGPMSFDSHRVELTDQGDYEALVEVTANQAIFYGDAINIERR